MSRYCGEIPEISGNIQKVRAVSGNCGQQPGIVDYSQELQVISRKYEQYREFSGIQQKELWTNSRIYGKQHELRVVDFVMRPISDKAQDNRMPYSIIGIFLQISSTKKMEAFSLIANISIDTKQWENAPYYYKCSSVFITAMIYYNRTRNLSVCRISMLILPQICTNCYKYDPIIYS